MRDCVRRFLTAAVATMELEGPMACLTDREADGEVAAALGPLRAGEMLMQCRLAAVARADEEIDLPHLPLAAASLGTVMCLDMLRRLDETARMLDIALTALAPGGIALVTVDTADARPAAGLSRVLTPLGLDRLIAGLDGAIVGWQGDVDFPRSLFLVACRPPAPPDFADRAGRLLDAFQGNTAASARRKGWRERAHALLRRLRRPRASAPNGSGEATCFSLHLPRSVDWKSAILTNERTPAAE